MTTVHDPERKRALVLRLKRVEGQLRGIQKLLETDADCEKVAQQLAAARKALDKTFFTMVGCVIAQGDLPADDVADMLADPQVAARGLLPEIDGTGGQRAPVTPILLSTQAYPARLPAVPRLDQHRADILRFAQGQEAGRA